MQRTRTSIRTLRQLKGRGGRYQAPAGQNTWEKGGRERTKLNAVRAYTLAGAMGSRTREGKQKGRIVIKLPRPGGRPADDVRF